jgi:hypothetical protein
MLINFDRETMPDELYNALLQHFVNEAVAQGFPVTKNTKFDGWVVQCQVSQPNLH